MRMMRPGELLAPVALDVVGPPGVDCAVRRAEQAALQPIDPGRVEVFNFKKSCEVSDFANCSSYRGIEPNAAWRKAALERIERILKADIRIEVVDAVGKPAPGVTGSTRRTSNKDRRFGFSQPKAGSLGREMPGASSRMPGFHRGLGGRRSIALPPSSH